MKKYLLFFILFSFSYTLEKIEYKINMLGIPAAKCIYSITDTAIYNQPALKINYKVKTIGLYNLFFKVENSYTVIFQKDSFEILSYSKNTIQPGINNQIKTNYFNNKVSYNNGVDINSDETNIFVLLYMISNNYFDEISNFPIIDREGKKYTYTLNLINDYYYSINLNQLSAKEFGVIEHTDVFTWGLFLPNTENTILIDSYSSLINKCVFKKGIFKMVAKRIK